MKPSPPIPTSPSKGKNGGARAGAGAKPFKPTAEQRERVWAGLALDMTIDELRSGVLNPKTGRPIDAKTFRANFPDEIETAKVSMRMEIAAGLVSDMRKNSVNSTRIFLSKALLGLRETIRQEFDPKSPLVVKWASAK